jgi:hypothetical protein
MTDSHYPIVSYYPELHTLIMFTAGIAIVNAVPEQDCWWPNVLMGAVQGDI